MTREEILDRLRDREDGFIERKREGLRAAELRQTLVAFANSVPEDRAAILFIGVADDGTPTGVESPDKLQKTIRTEAEQACYPPIRYQTELFNLEGLVVLAVIVEASAERPHFSGPAYVRRGSESVAASQEVYNELIASRNTKAGRILRHKGNVVTVIARKVLGSTKRERDPYRRSRHECRIEGVDAQFVSLTDLGSGLKHAEPLDRVTVGYDHDKERLLLEVDPP